MSSRTLSEHTRLVRELLDPALAALAAAAPDVIEIGDPALLGRVTAAALTAATALPPFDNSQMDGYAVRAADLTALTTGADASGAEAAGVTLRIGRTTAAGDPQQPHEPGTAAPVMTGAPIPLGADAVIPIEHADPPRFIELRRAADPAPVRSVRLTTAPAAGTFVRTSGSDLPAGATLLGAGVRLTPARIGLLASAGVTEVPVRRRPRVLLVATGDEVATPGDALGSGQIYDANTPLLAALLRSVGAVVTTHRTSDRPGELERLLSAQAPEVDLVITSGGISAGAYEVVRDALAPAGVEFTAIALQPGGPQGLGRWRSATASVPVLCFPGNPVSSALSAELFVAPALRGYAGRPEALPAERRQLAHAVDSPSQKHQVRRGRFDEEGLVHLTGASSHLLADLAAAELLAHVPVGVEHLPAGAPIDIWRIDD